MPTDLEAFKRDCTAKVTPNKCINVEKGDEDNTTFITFQGEESALDIMKKNVQEKGLEIEGTPTLNLVVEIETTIEAFKEKDETGLSPVMIFLIILFSAFGALLCGFLLYWLRGVQHSSDMEIAWKEEPESRLPRGTTWLSTSRGHTTKTHEDTDTEWHSINLEQEDKLEEQDGIAETQAANTPVDVKSDPETVDTCTPPVSPGWLAKRTPTKHSQIDVSTESPATSSKLIE